MSQNDPDRDLIVRSDFERETSRREGGHDFDSELDEYDVGHQMAIKRKGKRVRINHFLSPQQKEVMTPFMEI